MAEANGKKIYECGTLRYTLGGVILTSALIMVGFFCFHFAATAVNSAIALRIKALGSSDTLIAVIMTTIGGIFNITVCPAVSFKSDRYRGKRWGRRSFFIISTLPMLCAAMLLFGFSGPMGDALASQISRWRAVSPATVTLGLIALIMVFYKFFYMFVGSVIYYIYNDVIPQQFLARVVGLVQVAMVGAGAVFNFVFFRYCQSHFTWLMIGVSVLYAVGVGAMCFLIREPQYPPLTEEEKRQSRGGTGVVTFMRESFSHPFYWYGCLAGAFWSVATVINTYLFFFYQEMGMGLPEIGRIHGVSGITGMFLSMGVAATGAVLVDRWHPVRVNFYAKFFALLTPLLGLKWLFFTPKPEHFFLIFLIDEIVMLTGTYVIGISNLPMLMRTYPKSRYGQFCSAGAGFRSVLVLVMGLVLGLAIDLGRNLLGGGEFVYRFLWVWRMLWAGVSMFFMYLMYRQWQKLGGTKSYHAPAPWSPTRFEEMENSAVVNASPGLVRVGIVLWDAVVALYLLGGLGIVWYFRGVSGGMRLPVFCMLPGAIALTLAYLLLRVRIEGNLRRGHM